MEILHIDRYEDSRKTAGDNVGTGSRIPLRVGVFRIPFWGHISGADEDIFTKFGVCVENLVPQCVEWSMYACLEQTMWQTAAILNWLNRHNMAADCQIWLKFCTMTHTKVP